MSIPEYWNTLSRLLSAYENSIHSNSAGRLNSKIGNIIKNHSKDLTHEEREKLYRQSHRFVRRAKYKLLKLKS